MPWLLGAGLLLTSIGIVRADNGYTHFVIALVAIVTLVGVGLNVLYGLTGLISLGHVAFYAIGAYTSALLMLGGVNFFVALVASAALAALAGVLFAVPAVRVKGAFLAMVTIAFAFVVEHALVEWRSLTGGQNGLSGFPMPGIGAYRFVERDLALFATLCAFLALFGYRKLQGSGWGLAMKGIRDAEVASESLGYHPARIKTLAFGVSAALAGFAGALYTPLILFIAPSNFPFSQSILFLFSVIIGGVGATLGPLFGALVTVLLPELLSGLAEYRLLFFGALLLVVLLLAPSGLSGLIAGMLPRRRRHFGEPAADRAVGWLRAGMEPRALAVRDLSIAFGGVKAASGVSFSARPGQVLSLIGPNGAGKTTVLNVVGGFYRPDAGSVIVDGHDLAGRPAHRIGRAGIARTYQTPRLYEKTSVLENVVSGLQKGRVGHPFRSLDTPETSALAIALLRFAGYEGEPDAMAGSLPHVDRRLVELARALATAPSILLLDEPAAGLMRADKLALSRTLRRTADLGVAVVLVEHDMTLVMDISDEILVLDGGRPIASGTPDVVRRDERVIAAYLGRSGFEPPRRAAAPIESSAPRLATERLVAGYGAAPVLEDVDLEVHAGELVAVLGANGAGKSTLMAVLSGLMTPGSGRVLLDGEAVQSLPTHRIVERGLVLVPEGRQVFPELTVRQNIRLGAYRRDEATGDADLERLLERFPRLRDRLSSKAGLLSGGEQQMLAIARGLMSSPRVLLLDEPSLGLAPAMIDELYLVLAQLRDEGVTLLLVDQMANLALDVADRAYVLERGRVVAEGPSVRVRAGGLADAYLGASRQRDVAADPEDCRRHAAIEDP